MKGDLWPRRFTGNLEMKHVGELAITGVETSLARTTQGRTYLTKRGYWCIQQSEHMRPE